MGGSISIILFAKKFILGGASNIPEILTILKWYFALSFFMSLMLRNFSGDFPFIFCLSFQKSEFLDGKITRQKPAFITRENSEKI